MKALLEVMLGSGFTEDTEEERERADEIHTLVGDGDLLNAYDRAKDMAYRLPESNLSWSLLAYVLIKMNKFGLAAKIEPLSVFPRIRQQYLDSGEWQELLSEV